MKRNEAQIVKPISLAGQTYFTTAEMGCRCSVCQGHGKLADGFADALLDIRVNKYERAMPITSACRCVEHNARVGGAKGSFHIYENSVGCCAVDVRVPDSVARADLIEVALGLGWRVGINPAFIHLDAAPLYYSTEPRRVFLY